MYAGTLSHPMKNINPSEIAQLVAKYKAAGLIQQRTPEKRQSTTREELRKRWDEKLARPGK